MFPAYMYPAVTMKLLPSLHNVNDKKMKKKMNAIHIDVHTKIYGRRTGFYYY